MAAENPYPALRQLILTKPAATIANALNIPNDVRGILMDMAAPNGIATLVALSDSTTSLYISNGSGMLGLGAHAPIRDIVRQLLTTAAEYAPLAESTNAEDLPAPMRTRLHFLTLNGTRVYEAPEEDLGMNRLPMSPFFHQMHKLMSIARNAMLQKNAKKA